MSNNLTELKTDNFMHIKKEVVDEISTLIQREIVRINRTLAYNALEINKLAHQNHVLKKTRQELGRIISNLQRHERKTK